MACEYCDERGKEIIDESHDNGVDMLVYVDIRGKLIAQATTRYGDGFCHASAKLNFCPMCGRDLHREAR